MGDGTWVSITECRSCVSHCLQYFRQYRDSAHALYPGVVDIARFEADLMVFVKGEQALSTVLVVKKCPSKASMEQSFTRSAFYSPFSPRGVNGPQFPEKNVN